MIKDTNIEKPYSLYEMILSTLEDEHYSIYERFMKTYSFILDITMDLFFREDLNIRDTAEANNLMIFKVLFMDYFENNTKESEVFEILNINLRLMIIHLALKEANV